MTHQEIIDLVFDELKAAEKKHPGWPQDPVHAAAVLGEEVGELIQASIDFTYKVKDRPAAYRNMRTEAAQCAAMAIRFLLGFDYYVPSKGPQVKTGARNE